MQRTLCPLHVASPVFATVRRPPQFPIFTGPLFTAPFAALRWCSSEAVLNLGADLGAPILGAERLILGAGDDGQVDGTAGRDSEDGQVLRWAQPVPDRLTHRHSKMDAALFLARQGAGNGSWHP